MDKRIEIINGFYSSINEDGRLSANRHGQLEFLTTMNYIHKHVREGSKILEVGAGTGRYSITLAKEGYEVKALELTQHNVDILRQNSCGIVNIEAFQGDALDLSRFGDHTFDLTLVFGPMYHLYEEKDQHKCLDEAIRVTKEGGVIMVAFLSVYSILYSNYLQGNLRDGMEENFDSDYNVKHFAEQLFTGFDIVDFENLFNNKNTEYITTVATDSILELVEPRRDFQMSGEEFEIFSKYHLSNCEKRELLGCSNHLLYICKKTAE